MKNIVKIFSATLLLLISVSSCKSDDCSYDGNSGRPNCDVPKVNNEYAGMTVTTQYNSSPTGFVGQIVDTQMNATFPKGEDLYPILSTGGKIFRPANWTPNDIGQIFGIAIDDIGNVYLAASKVYDMAGSISPMPNNTRPAQVYKCSPPAYTAVALYTLPNTGTGLLNGIGNIAYDKINQHLVATNLEDGKLYIHDTSGVLIDSFDPFTADDGTVGIVAQAERIWAVGVNYESGKVKVYFPRITSSSREIYSIELDNSGMFIPATLSVEINNVPGTQNAITDIAFSSDTTKMLLAERGDPHQSKTMSYDLIGTSWGFNLQYFMGANVSNDGENSAGGVDFAYKEQGGDISANCDAFFWGTSNYMTARNTSNFIYGMEGVSYNGNSSVSTPTPNANQDTDYFFDFNGTLGTQDKGAIGDVEVFDANACFAICN